MILHLKKKKQKYNLIFQLKRVPRRKRLLLNASKLITIYLRISKKEPKFWIFLETNPTETKRSECKTKNKNRSYRFKWKLLECELIIQYQIENIKTG